MAYIAQSRIDVYFAVLELSRGNPAEKLVEVFCEANKIINHLVEYPDIGILFPVCINALAPGSLRQMALIDASLGDKCNPKSKPVSGFISGFISKDWRPDAELGENCWITDFGSKTISRSGITSSYGAEIHTAHSVDSYSEANKFVVSGFIDTVNGDLPHLLIADSGSLVDRVNNKEGFSAWPIPGLFRILDSLVERFQSQIHLLTFLCDTENLSDLLTKRIPWCNVKFDRLRSFLQSAKLKFNIEGTKGRIKKESD